MSSHWYLGVGVLNKFKRVSGALSVILIMILSIPAVSESNNIIPQAAAASSTLTVTTQDSQGHTITGYNVVLTQGGTTVASGFSPVTFTLTSGTQYSVSASSFGTFVFDHWLDTGSTVNPRPISITANTVITAVYRISAISLNPTSGPAGTTVTVTGINFKGNTAITTTYDGAAITTNPATITTTSTGGFTESITIPSTSTAGPHTVSAKSSGSNLASAQFTVTTTPLSTITLNPTSGPTGTSDTGTASNFVASSTVTIALDGTNLATTPATVTTTSTGSFSASVTIPSSATAAPHTISATDASANSASAQFTVTTPAITLNPTSGPTGTSVTVTGSNFVASSTVTIALDGTNLATTPATVTTTSTGSFSASVTIPSSATAAPHTISATDASANSASAQFTVTASATLSISLNTNTGNVGTSVRVTGTKFAPNSGITISYDGTAYAQIGSADAASPYNIKTDSTGGFVGIIEILQSVSGAHTISAQDAAANTASQSLTVLPHVFMYPSSGHAGSMILIPASQGNGFAANSAITIKFDGSTIVPSTAISSDAKGNFGGSFTVPSSASISPHQIQISDGTGNTYSSSYTVTDPSTPTYNTQTLVSGFNMADVLAFIPDNGPGVDGSGNLMIGEKNSGNIFVLKYTSGQFVKQSVPFVTIPNLQTSFEDNGVIGMAFDPNWVNTKLVYFDITRTVSGSVVDQVVRYHATTDSSGNIIADQTVGEQLVFTAPGLATGHNGGCLKFDSAGNLYIAVSDHWTFTGAQDLTKLDGKILRITPLASPVNGKLYSIPSTNPFASSSDSSIKKEIWGYGIRNVFTFDVDSKTSKVYASDVGYNSWERVDNFTAPGSNAGWPYYESPAFGNPQNLASYTPQVYWYPHDGIKPQTGPTAGNEAIQGAVFYHGTYYPNLDGAYLFGDYGVDFISALLPSSTAQTDLASGVQIGQVVPIYYGLPAFSPINMAVWNQKLYILDMGNLNVLNYDTGTPPPPPGNCATCQLTVKAQDVAGNSLGQYTVLSNSSGIVATGFAPATFNLKSGAQYTVEIGDHKNFVFDHWADTGSTASSRPISITTATTITAVFQDTALVLNPTGGFAGTTVTVNGTTFLPNHAITLTYDGGVLVTNPGTITSNSTGGFSVTFQVPLGSIGPHLVQAKDGTNTHSAIFTDRSN